MIGIEDIDLLIYFWIVDCIILYWNLIYCFIVCVFVNIMCKFRRGEKNFDVVGKFCVF